jgi:uncharacterized membrane protein
MTDRTNPDPDTHRASMPLFAAKLYAHRSLSRRGFAILMLLAAVPCAISAVVFAFAGAWPVSGFFGLDVAGLALAFQMNYRAARGFEEISLWRDDLLVRKHAPSGRIVEHRFNPFWARLRISRHNAIGITRLALAARDREVAIGEFLNPPDRKSFAEAFGSALRQAQGG